MFLQFMASLGTAYVFFISGTESNVQLIPASGGKSLVFGAITFMLPMLAGFAFGRIALNMDFPSSILLGAFFASSGHFRLPLLFRFAAGWGSNLFRCFCCRLGFGSGF